MGLDHVFFFGFQLLKPNGNFCRIYNQCHWWKSLGIPSPELWLAIGSVQKFWCRNHSDSNQKNGEKWGRHAKILLESLEVTHISHFFQWKDHPNRSTPPFVWFPKAMYSMSVEERMGPGGLDPVEVFESLPAELQECILAAFLRFFFLLPAVEKGIKYIEMGTIIFCFGGVCIKLQTYNAWAFQQDQLVRVPIWST